MPFALMCTSPRVKLVAAIPEVLPRTLGGPTLLPLDPAAFLAFPFGGCPSLSFLSPFERFLCLIVSVLSETGRGVPFIFW